MTTAQPATSVEAPPPTPAAAKSSAPAEAPEVATPVDAPKTPAPEASGPIPTTLGQQPKPKVDALDPPTRQSVRPIHTTDEVTPPAVDVEELLAQQEKPS